MDKMILQKKVDMGAGSAAGTFEPIPCRTGIVTTLTEPLCWVDLTDNGILFCNSSAASIEAKRCECARRAQKNTGVRKRNDMIRSWEISDGFFALRRP